MSDPRDELRRQLEAAKYQAIEERGSFKKAPAIVMPAGKGNAEADSKADLTAVQAAFRARAKAEEGRRELAVDGEFWMALYFKTRAQKEFFIKALKWSQFGDKYLSGELIARELGIDLPDQSMALKSLPKIDKDFAGLVK